MGTIAQHWAQTMLTKIRVLEQSFGYESEADGHPDNLRSELALHRDP